MPTIFLKVQFAIFISSPIIAESRHIINGPVDFDKIGNYSGLIF